MSALLCGFYPMLHAGLYIVLQIAGGISGSLLAAGLLPGAYMGMGDKGPVCFEPSNGISLSQLFGWEVSDPSRPCTRGPAATIARFAYGPPGLISVGARSQPSASARCRELVSWACGWPLSPLNP